MYTHIYAYAWQRLRRREGAEMPEGREGWDVWEGREAKQNTT